MAKVKPIAITTGANGGPVIIDSKGRVWAYAVVNGTWTQLPLPEEPDTPSA